MKPFLIRSLSPGKPISFALIVLFPLLNYSQSLVSVNPNNANAGQTLNVTITGAGTHFVQGSTATVNFGFNQGSPSVVNYFNALTNTSILANVSVPVNTYTGDYDVYVYNFLDGPLTLQNAFHVSGITTSSLVLVNSNSSVRIFPNPASKK